jgi:hypothetical protein
MEILLLKQAASNPLKPFGLFAIVQLTRSHFCFTLRDRMFG